MSEAEQAKSHRERLLVGRRGPELPGGLGGSTAIPRFLAAPKCTDLVYAYETDERLAQPTPVSIGIVDDVLTNSTHFRALQTALGARFPNVLIKGVFIAPGVPGR